ncbi:hypothetical protein [Bacillus horti]|nr:hypothetical protein [Bacillus horti]
MDQIISWMSENPLGYMLAVVILGPVPFLILYTLLKRKFAAEISALLSALMVAVPLFILSITVLNNPPYVYFAVLSVILIFYSIKVRSKLRSQ